MKPLALLSALLLTLAACSKHEPRPEASAPARQTVGALHPVAEIDWPELYRANATVQAKSKTTIAARVMGTVERVHVSAGDRVSAGQLLVTLEARELDSARAGAEAGEAAARASVPEIENAIRAAEAQLQLAESTRRRLKELYDKRSLAPQELDEADARVRQAAAGLAMAKARQDQARAHIEQATQAVGSARTAAAHRAVTAPFAGVVVTRLAEPGMVAAPGLPLLELERAGAYRLEIPIDESLAGQIKLGHPFSARFDDGSSLDLRVNEFAPSVDAASRTLTAKADLPAHAKSGAFARAEFALGQRRALAVPQSAVLERGQLQMVFVVDRGVARLRMVSLGASWNQLREVLSGLAPGDRVVAAPPSALTDGTPVESQQ